MTLSITPRGTPDSYTYFTFDAETLEDVANMAADQDEVGEASFHLGLGFDHENGVLTRVDLTVTLSLGMPEWTQRDGRPQAEKDEWDRFYAALLEHEEGHLAIFRREADAAYEALEESTPGDINNELDRQKARIQQLSDAYDHRTGHGQTQGGAHGNTVITV